MRLLLAPLCVLPSTAWAHLDTTGLGPVYDGVAHVLRSPEDLLPALAMAMLAGLNGPVAGRSTLFALSLAWLAGGLAGFGIGTPLLPASATVASLLVLGALVALDRRLSPKTVTTIAAALGLLHGWLNGSGIAEAGGEAFALAGIGGTVFVLVALGAALVVSLNDGWPRVAVRVAGSWVAAVGLLLLGWSMR